MSGKQQNPEPESQERSIEVGVYDNIPAESDLGQIAKQHITTVGKTTYQDTTCKRRHLRKLQNLAAKTAERKKSLDSTLDLSGTQLKKWVINLSKYRLKPSQTSILPKMLELCYVTSECMCGGIRVSNRVSM